MPPGLHEPSLKPPVHSGNNLPGRVRGEIVQHLLDLLDGSNFFRVHCSVDLRQKNGYPLQITSNTVGEEQQMESFGLQDFKDLVSCFCTLFSSQRRADRKSPSCTLPLLQSGTSRLQRLCNLSVDDIEWAQRQSLADPSQRGGKSRPKMGIAFFNILHSNILRANVQGHYRAIGHRDTIPYIQCHHGDPFTSAHMHRLHPGADIHRSVSARFDVQPLERPMHLLVQQHCLVGASKNYATPGCWIAACHWVGQRSKRG
mmetsp:Transcript_49900/g.108948  ORF Transcript_49900/g.108948 Transcript_49900/m.108948 type:complete len:257 (-) Transcript_49900:728-1498(-)